MGQRPTKSAPRSSTGTVPTADPPSREGLPLLPGPHVDVGLPRCANAWCARAEGPSEAGVRLQACGRCRAVGYCSAECQRADWAAGHKAACGRAAAVKEGATVRVAAETPLAGSK